MTEKNKPIYKIRSGNISGDIWVNKKEVDGEEREVKSASIKKSYKKEGEWTDTDIYFANDLDDLARVARKLSDYLKLKEY